MTLDRKDRLVSFRLSDEEYRALRNFCTDNGIRNLSEFARSALSQMVEARNGQRGHLSVDPSAEFNHHVGNLNETMTRLTKAVGRLSRLMEKQSDEPVDLSNPPSARLDP